MAKLYFKYGAMGSSKTANALITKFNYEEKGMKVWLIKPSVDNRDGVNAVRSRIGLQAEADVMTPDKDLFSEYQKHADCHVIIADIKNVHHHSDIGHSACTLCHLSILLLALTFYPLRISSVASLR